MFCGTFRNSYSVSQRIGSYPWQVSSFEGCSTGVIARWKEESQGTSPADRRSPYKLTYLSGAFKLYGVDGHLRLTFYNGQLMETQFTPGRGKDFMMALHAEMPKMPQKSAEEIKTDRRTHFRYDS
jgi:hypothetical protein